MDQPNEYEQAIEDYAQAVRREDEAHTAVQQAQVAVKGAMLERQNLWRVVREFVQKGHIKHGVYRLSSTTRHSRDAESLVINGETDYPDILPMFR